MKDNNKTAIEHNKAVQQRLNALERLEFAKKQEIELKKPVKYLINKSVI